MQDSLKPESHSILTIPPEICEVIVNHVDPRDLVSLRQVSREASQRADKQFLETFFSRRAFLLSSEDSLCRLLAIAEDDRLVRSMRRLDLCVGETRMWHEWYISTGSTRYCEFYRATDMRFTGPIDRVWAEERLRNLRGDEMWETLIEKRRAFSEQGIDRALLTKTFSRLEERLRSPIEVRIVDRLTACEIPYGLAKMEQLSGEILVDYDLEEKFVPFVLECLEQSALEVDSFAICFGGSYTYQISKLAGVQRKTDFTSRTFRLLKKLKLKFHHGPRTPPHAVIDNFCDFIESLHDLQNLSISISFEAGGIWELDSYTRLQNGLCGILRTKLPALKHLELLCVRIRTETLLEILPCMKNLETLHYHTWCRDHPPFWDEVSQMPKLARGNHRHSPTQAEIDSFRASCRCPSLKIATCTLLELASDLAMWNNV